MITLSVAERKSASMRDMAAASRICGNTFRWSAVTFIAAHHAAGGQHDGKNVCSWFATGGSTYALSTAPGLDDIRHVTIHHVASSGIVEGRPKIGCIAVAARRRIQFAESHASTC